MREPTTLDSHWALNFQLMRTTIAPAPGADPAAGELIGPEMISRGRPPPIGQTRVAE